MVWSRRSMFNKTSLLTTNPYAGEGQPGQETINATTMGAI
jgi:hypothetical protein